MFSAVTTAPAKQSVGETITVLSGRLSSATLLEDRRAAIQGLRSFAKEYPASVASGALRSLIGCLSKDGGDVDTVKVVLETLLMLFNPNEDSPEASEEIALWLADEFTQRQENITLLLDFLETPDFYSRLYSLQLLIAILAARTERTEECVFTAPLGISRLVAILDDRREAVRSEAITLLTYLSPSNIDIQKLVAFEDAFKRIFTIIESEGSLLEGGQVIEDCLILLANLLRLNASNQTQFRETGCVPQLSKMLQSAYQPPEDGEEVAPWAQAQRNRNVYALLAVIRLFLVRGAVGTMQNQSAFWHHHLLYHALQLAFSHSAENPIKAEALVTCADIIRGNSTLQENFAQLQVPSPLESSANGNGPQANGVPKVYVIDGLLDLTLCVHNLQAFDIRMAACECLKAYLYNHAGIREHFLRRAIEGHKSDIVESANVLTTLLRSPAEDPTVDPYRYWFAACIMLHLIFENATTKDLARQVTEGNEEEGEEVVTSIQIITSHLVTSLSRSDDERITIGYLMLLMCWLFEDLDGVNDLLEEGSNVQRLIQTVVKNTSSETIVQGLCSMLLGVVYEFSTKDSPIPRGTLQPLLMSNMGRDRYIDRMGKVRAHPFVRDFEMIPQKLDPSTGKLPEVYFDSMFVEFFKDNFSRILRAIDRDPGMEISVVTNGVQKGISRELVDSLRAQLDEKENALQECQASLAHLEQQLGQERADSRRFKETTSVDFTRLKSLNESLQRNHEDEIRQLHEQHGVKEAELQKHVETARKEAATEIERLQKKADAELQAKVEAYEQQLRTKEEEYQKQMKLKDEQHQKDTEEVRRQTEEGRRRRQSEADRSSRRAEAEKADLKATISRLEVDLMKANKSKTQEAQAAKEASERAEKKAAELQKKVQQLEAKTKKAEELLQEKEKEKESTQGELDDMLMLFADAEEKVNKYKEKLQALGETISDDEDGDEDDDDEEDAKDEDGQDGEVD
ncbi:Intracellular protein transport protein USO1 [Cytospora mali]|uniref:Intracellular protein transport protein USO1 n=1 Tax=Cytospora mali TaxID=578113 RepID=A0A194VTI6_CYTMA|nr:Intracellular protein transport protein USO1 [Valsa mali]